MKILSLFLLMNFTNAGPISEVSPGDAITSSKMNEIIQKVNSCTTTQSDTLTLENGVSSSCRKTYPNLVILS